MLEEIKEIQDSVGRASSMVRRPLGFSRHGQLQIKPVDAREVVTDATQTLTRTLTERVTVTLSCAPNAGLMRADADAVHQILLNLATNARDAMPRGGTLSISCDRAHLDAGYHATHPWIEPGEYVRIAVSDTGHGMDEATQARIFEPFFTTKERGKGTGLGLAMVYGLMRQHEGMAHVYSEPDQGTIFRLYFPIASASQPDNPAGRDGSPIHDDPRPRTILVIEDEVGVRRSIVRALTAWGYRTLTASDGEEGLEILALADHGIDLVISDLVMPKLGGRQVLDIPARAGDRRPLRPHDRLQPRFHRRSPRPRRHDPTQALEPSRAPRHRTRRARGQQAHGRSTWLGRRLGPRQLEPQRLPVAQNTEALCGQSGLRPGGPRPLRRLHGIFEGQAKGAPSVSQPAGRGRRGLRRPGRPPRGSGAPRP